MVSYDNLQPKPISKMDVGSAPLLCPDIHGIHVFCPIKKGIWGLGGVSAEWGGGGGRDTHPTGINIFSINSLHSIKKRLLKSHIDRCLEATSSL